MTDDLGRERERLALAEQQIADTETRITVQEVLIARKGMTAEHLAQAERLLAGLRRSLDAIHHHRDLILDALDRKGRGEGGRGVPEPAAGGVITRIGRSRPG